MSSPAAFYFLLHSSMSHAKYSWKREYFELTADGRLSSVSEYEDKTSYTSIHPKLWLPPGVTVITRADYRAAKLRHVLALRETFRKSRAEKEARKLLHPSVLAALDKEQALAAATPKAVATRAGLLDDFTVLDLEFQGTALLEVAAIRYQKWVEVKRMATFVRFDGYITPPVADLTGITQADVAKAPEERVVLQAFKQFAEESVLVCHNIAADRRILEAARTRQGAGGPLSNAWLCTLALARLRHPKLLSHKLGDLCREFNIAAHGAHRALRDVEMCFELARVLHQQHPITELVTSSAKSKAKAAAHPTLFAPAA
jgi:DNA polymerase-3 subunit epsilon